MESGSKKINNGGWVVIPTQILAGVLALAGMSADEVVRNVSFVCSSWREALCGLCCWSDVTLDQWCRRIKDTNKIDETVMMLLTQSERILRSLSVYMLGNPAFSFACSRILHIPMSFVSDKMVEKYVESLPVLEVHDIRHCLNISSKGIKLFGKHRERLIHLGRNMSPPDFMIMNGLRNDCIDESEAIAVATSMPSLEHLKLKFGMFNDHGLRAIIGNCQALRVLDICSCVNVKIEEDLQYAYGLFESFKDPWEYQNKWVGENY